MHSKLCLHFIRFVFIFSYCNIFYFSFFVIFFFDPGVVLNCGDYFLFVGLF